MIQVPDIPLPKPARWFDLANLPLGEVVEFIRDWDIFPEGLVPAGTRARVVAQEMNGLQPIIHLAPITPLPGLDLAESNGHIVLAPIFRADKADEYTPAPVRIITERMR